MTCMVSLPNFYLFYLFTTCKLVSVQAFLFVLFRPHYFSSLLSSLVFSPLFFFLLSSHQISSLSPPPLLSSHFCSVLFSSLLFSSLLFSSLLFSSLLFYSILFSFHTSLIAYLPLLFTPVLISLLSSNSLTINHSPSA